MRRTSPFSPGLMWALLGALAGCATETAPDSANECADCAPPAPDGPRDDLRPAAPPPVAGTLVRLDERVGGALRGRLAPVRAHTDEGRVLTLETDLDGPLGAALAGLAVRDARFVSFGVVVIGEDHELVAYDEAGTPHRLDGDAYGPLSVAGGYVAYTRGAPPDLELFRAHLLSGVVEPLTEGMAPVWSPALSADGREVLFVASPTGTPRLHRLDGAGALDVLPATARIPSAPTAPLWLDGELLFEDEAGVVSVELASGAIVEALDGARSLARGVDGRPLVELDGARLRIGGAR